MSDTIPVTITAGTLAPPACYSNEQDRYNAYIAATTASITGSNLQWIVSVGTPAPADQGKAWLRIDVNGYPKEVLLWVTASGTWVRIFTVPHYPVSSGGVANALTATYNPTFLSQAVGERYWFIAAATNTAACTFKVDSLPAYSIKKKVNQDLAAGEIVAGQVVELVWDGTNYQMVSQSSKASISTADIAAGTDGQTLRTRNVAAVPTTVWETSVYGTVTSTLELFPAAGNSASFLHGLGETPIGASCFIQCVTAELGYSEGDRYPWDGLQYQVGTDEIYSLSFMYDSTVVTAIRPSDAGTIEIFLKDGSGGGPITTTNWKVGAWAFK